MVLSDWIKVRITAAQGSTFLDRMIALVEGAERQKTPNEIALNILLAGLTLIFVFAVATIPSFANYAGGTSASSFSSRFSSRSFRPRSARCCQRSGSPEWTAWCVSMSSPCRDGQSKLLATSTHCFSTRPGTITLGNRQATEFIPLAGVSEKELADAAQLASFSDETPEGRSIVVLAKEKYGIRGREMPELNAKFVPFTAYTRLSGVDPAGR